MDGGRGLVTKPLLSDKKVFVCSWALAHISIWPTKAQLQAFIITIKLDMILCRNRVYRQICESKKIRAINPVSSLGA